MLGCRSDLPALRAHVRACFDGVHALRLSGARRAAVATPSAARGTDYRGQGGERAAAAATAPRAKGAGGGQEGAGGPAESEDRTEEARGGVAGVHTLLAVEGAAGAISPDLPRTSPAPRLHLAFVWPLSRLHLLCTSSAPPLHLLCISHAPPMHLLCT